MQWFDSYERRARMVPGLLMLFSLTLAGVAVGANRWPYTSWLLGALTAVGAPLVLASWVRDKGAAAQERLWSEWGGAPTHRALKEPGSVAQRRRAKLSALVGFEVSPSAADADLDQAVRMLIRQTSESATHPLVFEENRNYGFVRNLYGVRFFGAGLATACLVLLLTLALPSWQGWFGTPFSSWTLSMSATGELLLIIFWTTFPTKSRVERAARRYCERLLESLDIIDV